MAFNRLLDPATSALNILEEYHKDIGEKLRSYGLGDDIRTQIITDIYAKDDIYFSLNRSYEHIETSFADFCREYKLHEALPDMLPRLATTSLYKHQKEAINSILSERTTIISTGTGSGKTESFLIPILHHCLVQKSLGIKAIIIYPLNALANDQVERIISAVKGRSIRVGCFIGATPQIQERKSGDMKEQCISRQEMIDNPPDILITNYVMLDRLITNPKTRPMFVDSAETLKYIVIDEIHYFRGTRGANLSLLLRRLRTLCKHPLVQVGASGTLRSEGGYFPDSKKNSIEQFARLIFGYEAVMEHRVKLIEPIFQKFEQKDHVEPLPEIDAIKGNSILDELDKAEAEKLYEQLSGKPLTSEQKREYNRSRSFADHPMYHFALRNQFIARMREKLEKGACTLSDFVSLFCELYTETYPQKMPSHPREVVKAYWSLINHINYRCGAKLPLILDYRLHMILGNVGDSLTCCLLCKRYHDGRCLRCRHCSNGLLFQVSKEHPSLCIAYLAGQELFPTRPLGIRTFDVLVQVSPEQILSSETVSLHFELEPNLNITTNEESYLLRPASSGEEGIVLRLSRDKQEMEALPLSESRSYWHNVLKVVDALVIRSETKTTDKLLGFIDNKERASSIKLRLNDEIAERTVTSWAINKWLEMGTMKLTDAFDTLQREAQAFIEISPYETDKPAIAPLHEVSFWFARMLTSLDEYDSWKIYIDKSLPIEPHQYTLLNDILLPQGAIDTRSFLNDKTFQVKMFHLEKYKVDTQYGVGLHSTSEPKYNIISLGEQGRRYKDFVEQMGSRNINIKETLDTLTEREILVKQETPNGIPFYQLYPRHLILQIISASKKWEDNYTTVECHTADHSDQERSSIEARFKEPKKDSQKIHALICTPTLEMGVDIGSLSSVLMIGFPPSPANYAQRAGRAGRSDKSRQATIVVLSSPEDAHDEYYYALPSKMIDGAITPPQFTFTNFALLASHVYAYLAAGAKNLSFLCDLTALRKRVRDFISRDELHLRSELDTDYTIFAEYLDKDSQTLPDRLRSHKSSSLINYCYEQGIFPDYGFRSDGMPLFEGNKPFIKNEDEIKFLTTRESEEAPRKLVPGRVVFCSGKAVKVDENQPGLAYEVKSDPAQKNFRKYNYVVSDEKNEVQVEKKRDPETLYRLSRFLDVKQPLNTLDVQGPLYCRTYLVRQGILYFINEGKVQQNGKPLQLLRDYKGDYRFGTSIERDGLLIHFADQLLSSSMKANFLAALLRGIPDYFDLDDSELRVAQNLRLYPQVEFEFNRRSAFFIYGHDESGLVPFGRIFEHLENMLHKTLHTLQTCSCKGEGCYLCLFSLNSRSLPGRISHQGAADFLLAYLRQERLKPYIAPAKNTMAQPDVILSLSLQKDCCQIAIERMITGKHETYKRENVMEDVNTRAYTALREVLEQEWEQGARTVKIRCNVHYICEQLRGENDVEKGREAFLSMWLTLLHWRDWQIEKV